MDITEVRISAVGNRDDKLRAFCSVTFDDCFVVRDIRVIEGNKGLFIAMPSRKLSIRCPGCGYKNVVRSQYCNNCGSSIPRELSDEVERGRTKLHADIAHPILTEFREEIQDQVLVAFDQYFENQESQEKNKSAESAEVVHAGGGSDREEAGATRQRPRARGPAEEEDAVGSPEAPPQESAEAEFLGKDAEQDKSAKKEKMVDLPPPEDNFSSGLF
ncbi:MAG: SpoVG family protein [Planctomycetota bacterium]|nr:SpoVG family protein [Planctomycetota bacterium]